jgi:outer membrane phospholipase A
MRKTTFVTFVWVRLGDADSYNRFDELPDAAEYMALFGVKHVYRTQKYGVAAKGFTGLNYISLFFGDDEAQPTRDLSGKDVRLVNECLLQEERR